MFNEDAVPAPTTTAQIPMAADKINKHSTADLIIWMDIHRVLRAEGLLPKWKREAIQRLVPTFKRDASHMSPWVRLLKITLVDVARENPAGASLV